jgi:type II secretory ATPase GspE/PulE/Tfp pilus assembly ATPase PilB-like protein
MAMNEELRALVLDNASGDKIRAAAIRGGMRLLRQDGVLKALLGITTVEEVLRVTAALE